MAQGDNREADYGEILLAIVERLKDQVKGCNKATCYFALDPDSGVKGNPGTHVVVVAPASGSFLSGAFGGGGRGALSVDGGFFVKVHCPSDLDQEHKDVQAITSASLGVIRKGTAVLAALVEPWLPTVKIDGDFWNASGYIQPVNFQLDKDPEDIVRAIQYGFSMPFDWDLTKQ